MTEKRVAPWIEQHLWQILAAVGALYAGYLTGMTTINHRVDTLEVHVTKLEARLDLLAPRVERLDARDELTRQMEREQ